MGSNVLKKTNSFDAFYLGADDTESSSICPFYSRLTHN